MTLPATAPLVPNSSEIESVPRLVYECIKRRAVLSARVLIETLCQREGGPEAMTWDTQQLQSGYRDRESSLHDLLDIQDAVLCLELLGLLRHPFPDRPHVVSFRTEIQVYEPRLPTRPSSGTAVH